MRGVYCSWEGRDVTTFEHNTIVTCAPFRSVKVMDNSGDHSPEKEKAGLKQNIGLCNGVGILVGIIIGSGIFVSPVGVLEPVKSVGVSFIIWIVTGVFCIFGALVYAELGVAMPVSGGEYTYVLLAFGPLPAFVVLWITYVVIGGASAAANALIFANYILRPAYWGCDIPLSLVRMVAIFGLSMFNRVSLSPTFFSYVMHYQLLQQQDRCSLFRFLHNLQRGSTAPDYRLRRVLFGQRYETIIIGSERA